jgi:hypothetical protein
LFLVIYKIINTRKYFKVNMASQVLSGASNPSYTNTTGENVRIIINYMQSVYVISWSGVAVNSNAPRTIGRNLAFINLSPAADFGVPVNVSGNNMAGGYSTVNPSVGLPTELMIAPGETFSATCGVYNIVIIPEGG